MGGFMPKFMPKFVTLPHGYTVELGRLWYFQVVRVGDPDKEYIKEMPNGELRDFSPVALTLHFRNGETIEIPPFEAFFLEEDFHPALDELEKGVVDDSLFDPYLNMHSAVDIVNDNKDKGVYFLQGEITKRVKIGYTTDLEKRIKALQTSEPLRLVGFMRNASPEREKEIHDRFSHLRAIGEWFEGSPEIANYLEDEIRK